MAMAVAIHEEGSRFAGQNDPDRGRHEAWWLAQVEGSKYLSRDIAAVRILRLMISASIAS